MANTRKIRLPGQQAKRAPVAYASLWNVGQIVCSGCHMMLSQAIEIDASGEYKNFNPETAEIVVRHPSFRGSVCPNQGKLLRWKFTAIPMEVLD